MKKQANDLKSKVATAQLSLQEAKTEERMLSSKIVKSPKRIKREMEQSKKFLDLERKGLDDIEKEVLLSEKRIMNVKDCINDIQKSSHYLENELKGNIQTYDDVLNQVKQIMKDKEDNENMEKKLLHEKRDLEHQIRHIGEKYFFSFLFSLFYFHTLVQQYFSFS